MPAPVPQPILRAVLRRLEGGDSVAEVAAVFGLAPRTVCGIRQRGEARLQPASTRPPVLDPSAHPADAPALLLRREEGLGSQVSAMRILQTFTFAGVLPACQSWRVVCAQMEVRVSVRPQLRSSSLAARVCSWMSSPGTCT